MPRPKTLHPYTESKFKLAVAKHLFVIDPKDDYRCLTCQQPRALHPDTEPEVEPATLHRPTTHEA